MAIRQKDRSVLIQEEERTNRIIIQTPRGGDPTVEINRERIVSSEGGVISVADAGQVIRSFRDVASDFVEVQGIKLTGALMAEAIAAFADKWREEDLAAAKQEKVDEQVPPDTNR